MTTKPVYNILALVCRHDRRYPPQNQRGITPEQIRENTGLRLSTIFETLIRLEENDLVYSDMILDNPDGTQSRLYFSREKGRTFDATSPVAPY